MKNLLAITLLLLPGYLSLAQETNTSSSNVPANAVRLNVFRTFTNNFHVSYERDISPRSSLVIGNGLYLKDTDNKSLLGYSGDLQYRFTLRSRYNKTIHTTSRYYFAPKVWGAYLDQTDRGYLFDWYGMQTTVYTNSIIRFAGIGGFIGLRIISSYHFDFDTYFGCGVQYADNINFNASTMLQPGYTGVVYKAGLQFGVNF